MLKSPFNHHNIVPFAPPCTPTKNNPFLLVTTTDEPYMPIRLYYDVNPNKITGHFVVINCISKSNKFWDIFCRDELALSILKSTEESFQTEPPLVFGRAIVNYKQHKMIVDTDSYHRAIFITNFLNKYIPKGVITLQHAASYNKYIYTKSANSYARFVDYSNYNMLFENSNLVVEVANIKSKNLNQKKPSFFPLIEKFPIGEDSNQLQLLGTTLQLKFTAARNISEGNICPDKSININNY
jgi:hypothetical protein